MSFFHSSWIFFFHFFFSLYFRFWFSFNVDKLLACGIVRLLKHHASMRSNFDTIYIRCVHQYLTILLASYVFVVVVVIISIKRLCLWAFHFVGRSSLYQTIWSGIDDGMRILVLLLAYIFTWWQKPCTTYNIQYMHKEHEWEEQRGKEKEHNVQDVYADYNQTNLLYYYTAMQSIMCTFIHIYV